MGPREDLKRDVEVDKGNRGIVPDCKVNTTARSRFEDKSRWWIILCWTGFASNWVLWIEDAEKV